jgi:hypothetical protein
VIIDDDSGPITKWRSQLKRMAEHPLQRRRLASITDVAAKLIDPITTDQLILPES